MDELKTQASPTFPLSQNYMTLFIKQFFITLIYYITQKEMQGLVKLNILLLKIQFFKLELQD